MSSESYEAVILRVMGPDVFEARVQLGFGVETVRQMKLSGVSWDHVNALSEDARDRATEALREMIEGQFVKMRVIQRGQFYYARVFLVEEDVLECMVQRGYLARFEKPQ